MSFLVDIRHWPTLEAFRAHLWAHNPQICAWATEIVYHHTWKPTAAQWRGRPSVDGLLRYYRDTCHWSAGPHLFIAPDGIWQLSPLDRPGIHANAANPRSWGLEVVGDYDKAPWPTDLAELAYGAGEALLQWRGLAVSELSINGHRRYNRTKSCPGWAINVDGVRAELARRLANDLTFIAAPRISRDQFVWVLARALSPAAAEGGAMYDAIAAEGVDPALGLAFFQHESTFGHKGLCAEYDLKNPGNVRTPMNASRGQQLVIPNRGQFFRYRSWALGAQDWAVRMRDKYARTLGLPSVRTALPTYAPSSDGNRPAIYGGAVLRAVRQWQLEDL